MKKRSKKVLITSIFLSLGLGSAAYGFGIYTKDISATFNRLNVTYNGQNVTNKVQGFISGGSSYLPLRSISNVFGLLVDWDPVTNTAVLTDYNLQGKILEQEREIKSLEEEVKRLKEDRPSSSSSKSLSSLERDLRKTYGSYKKLDFDIDLRGDSRDIDLKIGVDLYNSKARDRWEDLRERDIEDYIEDLVKDIQKEYRQADVEGYIEDLDRRETLYDFDKRSSGRIYIKKRQVESSSSRKLEDLERDLNNDYYDYLDSLKLELRLDKKKDLISFHIYTGKDRDHRDWTKLPRRRKERLLRAIRSEIASEYRDADIVGHIWAQDSKTYELGYIKNEDLHIED